MTSDFQNFEQVDDYNPCFSADNYISNDESQEAQTYTLKCYDLVGDIIRLESIRDGSNVGHGISEVFVMSASENAINSGKKLLSKKLELVFINLKAYQNEHLSKIVLFCHVHGTRASLLHYQ